MFRSPAGSLLLVVTLAAGVAACKKPKNGGSTSPWPQRLGTTSDATAAVKVGVLGAGGGATLQTDLRRVQLPGEAGMGACMPELPDDFPVARAVCAADATNIKEIAGANVEMICSGALNFTTVPAKQPLSLDGCAAYDVFAYEYNPKLPLKIK